MRFRALLIVGILLAAQHVALAQGRVVTGTVIDETGGVLPGATVTLTGPNVRAVTTSGGDGAYRFAAVAPGTYQIAVTLSAFAPASRSGIVVAAGDVTVPPITLVLAGFGEIVVVSASRVENRLIEAPATMTVLSGTALAASSASNIGEVLRQVPGMNVIQMSARDINLTSRLATSTLATSQLALLDGRSIYLDFFGLILWDFVPTNVNDIRQIEVVRGPASAVWGANALTGVVNIITKSPRETAGTTNVTLSAGWFDRDVGSTAGAGVGTSYGASVSTSQVVNDQWSYRLSAGYFNSDPFARPTGQIPIIPDPRDPSGTATVGGAVYPADASGPLGFAFQNVGTSQPKFDARVDQELSNARVTYAGGVAGTEGAIYTGIGPFDIQRGSYMAYGKMNYTRDALRFNVFTNIVRAEAPNLLVPDPRTQRPVQLDFKTETFDVELGHSRVVGRRHALSYGGNYRRNNFDITLAPSARDRNEIGGYLQDEIFFDHVRVSVGGRVDKFGNIDDPVFSPRVSVNFLPRETHSLRLSFNRAFRSPSTVNNYLDLAVVTPVSLQALSPILPPPLRPLVASPFPLVVESVGSELPIGGVPQSGIKQESLTAYEIAYTGTFNERTTLGAAFYVNDVNDSINFVQLPTSLDPYTDQNPPPGWRLPPGILTAMGQLGIFLPRTGFTYLNLGPTRQKGLELSLDQRVFRDLSAFANYSWQDTPTILDDPDPYPIIELALPPTHRFNLGASYDGRRYLGTFSVNVTDDAFWSDVLTSAFHGYTESFTLVNGSVGVKWRDGAVTTAIKVNNLLNQTVQQHIFGDLMRRSVTAEARFDF